MAILHNSKGLTNSRFTRFQGADRDSPQDPSSGHPAIGLDLHRHIIRQHLTVQSCLPLKSFAGEMQSDAGELAANAVEGAPEIGGFAVGVVEDDG